MTVLAPVLARLLARARFGLRPGLERTRALLDTLGAPDEGLRVVHVAGTNGKGSVAAMCAAGLSRCGVRVGLFTSPHLARFAERVRVDGLELDDAALARQLDRALQASEEATFFEIATAAALCAFREAGVDIAVLEVGLGGRLDATNAARGGVGSVSLITAIARDHQAVLGEDLAGIAREKAGILRVGRPAIALEPEDPAVRAALEQCAAERGAGLRFVEAPRGRPFDFEGSRWRLRSVTPSLGGIHQCANAALALAAGEALDVDAERYRAGLEQARWAGRLEQIDDVLLDCAHNEAGAIALASYLAGANRDRALALVFGHLDDKDGRSGIAPLLPHIGEIVLVAPPGGRGADPASLAAWLRARGRSVRIADSVAEALAARRGPTLVAGSIYLVGAARALLLGERPDPVATSDPAAKREIPSRLAPRGISD
ncbi:MAG: bifunctional folylpolyglutamate synthase/dihydrofolate synthase [Myxococcales bacterium]|nr:bifunctional folylpolyglutamate synthase/dihydrofolate synthase [Myxococcales bacterium]